MQAFYEKGIVVQDGKREVVLDPKRGRAGSVVSHGHMDHLSSGGYMTPGTLDILKARRKRGTGTPIEYDREVEVEGFDVTLREAGHTFASAMIRVDDVLYTGDFNPEGGVTCGRAEPEWCQTLILEATYGRPSFHFPDKRDTEADLVAWTELQLAHGPVAIGGYEFGKAQELIALMNRAKLDVAVPAGIADLADVYRRHGVKLQYRRTADLSEDERKDPRVYIVPGRWFRALPEEETWLSGARTAYVSGWCTQYDFTRTMGIDAQFPLSDHGDFDDLMEFAAHCRPRRVYTVFTHATELAREIARKLKVKAEPLAAARRKEDAIFG
jgi:Cft2 family RNA processing exonuclease